MQTSATMQLNNNYRIFTHDKHELEVLVDNIGYPTTNNGFMVMVMGMGDGDGHADPAN